MLSLGIISWKGVSRFNEGSLLLRWGASFLSVCVGVVPHEGASILMGGFWKKIKGWGGHPCPLWETLDPQLITDVITFLCTTAAQKYFLYYNLMGLRFWPWNFHQQGQGFHSRKVGEFVRGSGKVREIWYFLGKVSEK